MYIHIYRDINTDRQTQTQREAGTKVKKLTFEPLLTKYKKGLNLQIFCLINLLSL